MSCFSESCQGGESCQHPPAPSRSLVGGAGADMSAGESAESVDAPTVISKRLAVRPTSLFGGGAGQNQSLAAGKRPSNLSQASASTSGPITSQTMQVLTKQQSSTSSAAPTAVSVTSPSLSSSSPPFNAAQQSLPTRTQRYERDAKTRDEQSLRNNSTGNASLTSQQASPQMPYPQYAPVSFYMNQTAKPRSWCLSIVSNKYPAHSITPTKR